MNRKIAEMELSRPWVSFWLQSNRKTGLNWKVQVLSDGRSALGSLLPMRHSLQKTALLFSVCICSGKAQKIVRGHQMNTCEQDPRVD